MSVDSCAWPLVRIGELAVELGLAGGLRPNLAGAPPTPPDGVLDPAQVERWLEAVASFAGLVAERADVRYGDLEHLLTGSGAAILSLPGDGPPRFLGLVDGRGGAARLLAPDGTVRRVTTGEVRQAVARRHEDAVAGEVEALLTAARVSGRRAERARRAILRERLRHRRIVGCWLLAPRAAGFAHQARLARLPARLALVGVTHAVQYLLWLATWWIVGRAAFGGELAPGWLLLWACLLLSLIPIRMLATWSAGVVTTVAGGLLKQLLLDGALKLEPDEIRHQGVGQMLGRVVESEAVEQLTLSGGFLGLVALVELGFAAVVLALGAGGALHPVLLVAWLGVTLVAGSYVYRRRRRWTLARLDLTHRLVERLVGQRTRQAQESRADWHRGEDEELEGYLAELVRLDRVGAVVLTLVPRGWLIVGILGLTPALLRGAEPAALALAVGGILLATRAFAAIAAASAALAGAATTWEIVAPLVAASRRRELVGVPALAARLTGPAPAGPGEAGAVPAVVEAHDLVFRYRPQGEPVLAGVSLRMGAGERLLIEGPSGGGKSTLASLLVGLRQPDSGLLLLTGFDRPSLGARGWQRRAVSAPQFHDNRVFAATMAFNLLMGRGWPATAKDLDEAEAVCRELGLGPLIERMPARLQQMVGETGWQLSHGEKSRLFIARALLQDADLVVLDESFAALDPISLRRALRSVLARAPALVVIAHP